MSFLLVIVATIFLVAGLFLTQDLVLIFISIGCSALAGLVLVTAVLRSRPKRTDAVPIEEEQPSRAVPAGSARREADTGFPIENYDSLEVVDVLPLLGELSPAALEKVRAREAGGRAHPWVLARIDALLESEAEAETGEWDSDEFGPGDEWAEPQPEWAEEAEGRADWAASDFELESSDAGGFGEPGIARRDFPIADYDSLRATDILPLLTNLDTEDLKLVREAEAGAKARTSILSRIDALLARGVGLPGVSAPARRTGEKTPSAANLPIADYDSLTVGQITSQLSGLSAAELRTLRAYEKHHKARTGVIQKLEAALLRAE